MFSTAIAKPHLSPRFIPFLALFIVSAVALFFELANPSIATFIFVFCGWIISLCLHEAGHALVAYFGGDKSVIEKGYLNLDPLAYAHPELSIGLPILYLLMGGLGLPGGCVYIDHRVMKNRYWDSAVSAAGPAANILCLIILGLPFAFGLQDQVDSPNFWAAMAFLAWLQVSAIVFNLLPIPGLDGFGIWQPHLPFEMQAQANMIARMLPMVLMMLIFVPQVGSAISIATNAIATTIGIDSDYIGYGYALFRFKA